tara:strand:+ start:294 stop:701 length:408 start_codon:yes stop_codon:yes gene_type:complete
VNHRREKYIALILGLMAIGFGAMTIKSGGFALFGGIEGKEFAGKYAPFVLWFNFIAGFFYVIAGIGIILRAKWALKISFALAIFTSLIFIAFGVHIFLGSPYEMRTVGAMTVRCLFWFLISTYLLWKEKRTLKTA